ncbi:DUF6520 family protein [Gelidibacter sp. F63206]|uniref:DUF6520 family protein n=1 Tax=Gelidibacter sp. F63206 TaxID=2926425 RepID=UPI001FF343B7|nr:DUF6520 family protein [Gelidibacter sp. F63206]MCK0115253.1 DUF6520 family protein [Gelidibacter sp. F63206]
MKKFKFLIPMMVFVMAIGMAFASKINPDTGLWVERNGVPYQLQSNPCTSNKEVDCRVVFAGDPNAVEHQVYTDQNFINQKKGGTLDSYILME